MKLFVLYYGVWWVFWSLNYCVTTINSIQDLAYSIGTCPGTFLIILNMSMGWQTFYSKIFLLIGENWSYLLLQWSLFLHLCSRKDPTCLYSSSIGYCSSRSYGDFPPCNSNQASNQLVNKLYFPPGAFLMEKC